MFGSTDVIVGFWFLPVTLFIILPLVMFCGWLVFKTVAPRKSSRVAVVLNTGGRKETPVSKAS